MFISHDYPFLEVNVAVRSLRTSCRALIDTGFDGYLILPLSFSGSLGAADSHAQWTLADGTPIFLPEYRGGIEIMGLGLMFMARIIVMGDECLIGQGIIKRLKVTLDHGSEVVVEP